MENSAKIILFGIVVSAFMIYLQIPSIQRLFSSLETTQGGVTQITHTSAGSGMILEKTIQPDSAMLAKAQSIDKIWRYALFIPQNYTSGKKYPLIIGLHGEGQPTTQDCGRMRQTNTNSL